MVITAASPAELIALTAAPGPPQTCPHHCGEGEQRQKKGSAFLHRVCAFLSSCMEIIPIGGNCFPDKKEGAAGVPWVRGFGGSQGQDHVLGGQEERGQVPTSGSSLPTRDTSCYWNETSCPAVPPHLPLALSSPVLHGSWTRAVGSARICQRMPTSAGGQSPHCCPLCCLSCRTPTPARLGAAGH